MVGEAPGAGGRPVSSIGGGLGLGESKSFTLGLQALTWSTITHTPIGHSLIIHLRCGGPR